MRKKRNEGKETKLLLLRGEAKKKSYCRGGQVKWALECK